MNLLPILVFYFAMFFTANTWFVRSDGGTRYDATAVPTGQCDGLADAAYPGTGVNQHCAFNDMRYLWTTGAFCNDGTPSSTCWVWIGAGGDTYKVRDCIQWGTVMPFVTIPGTFGPCTIGQQGPQTNGWGISLAGDPNNSGWPFPHNGMAGAHTVIEGYNVGNCLAQGQRTQIYGTYAVGEVFKMGGTQYVDVACFDISDQSSCGRNGQTNQCSTTPGALSDFAGVGLGFSNTMLNDTFTDMRLHGLASLGIFGPPGDGVNLTDVQIVGNAGAGWNADDGDGTTGLGTQNITHFSIEWNGCTEEFPIVDALPYQDCADDGVGGYGDGFGTATTLILTNGIIGTPYSYQIPPSGTIPDTYVLSSGTPPPGISISSSGLISGTPTTSGIYTFTVEITDSSGPPVNFFTVFQMAVGSFPQGWHINWIDGIVDSNTQDGIDCLHCQGTGSTMSITRVLAFNNMGNQFKNGTAGIDTNNIAFGNCRALSTAIPGTPSGYNSRLSSFCRAGGELVINVVNDGTTMISAFNTFYCSDQDSDCGAWICNTTCTTTSFAINNNNIILGFNEAGGLPGRYALGSGVPSTLFQLSGSSYSNNNTSNTSTTCPDTAHGEVNGNCLVPQLITTTWPVSGSENVKLSGGSNMAGIGLACCSVSSDFTGAPRPTPPSIGAYDVVGILAPSNLKIQGIPIMRGVFIK